MLGIREQRLLHNFSQGVDRCTCFMNHAACPMPMFEKNGPPRTINHPSWDQLQNLEART